MTEFDMLANEFTRIVQHAADWKDNYFGARYSTRIAAAIVDLETAIRLAKRNVEIAAHFPSTGDQHRRRVDTE